MTALPAVGVARPVGRLRALASAPDRPAYTVVMCVGVLAGALSGNWRAVGVPLGLDRLIVAGAFMLVLFDATARAAVPLRLRAVHVLMAATVLDVAASAASVGTLGSSYALYALVDRIGALPYLAFTLAPRIFGTPARRDLLVRTLVCFGLYLAVTAVFEEIGPHALVFPRYIMNPDLGIHFGRARGPFLEADADGAVLAACGFVAGIGVARFRGRWRIASAVAVPMCGLGVFLTLTRGAWVAGIVSAVAVALVTPTLRRWLLPVTAAATVAVGVVIVATPGLSDRIQLRTGDQRSVWDRDNTNAAALRILDEKPLTGVGWTRFVASEQDWIRQADTYPITASDIEVHNMVLSRAAELGIPGAALWVATGVLGLGGAAVRRPPRGSDLVLWRRAFLGIVLSWFVGGMFVPMSVAMPNTLVWLTAGVVAGPYLSGRGTRTHSPVSAS